MPRVDDMLLKTVFYVYHSKQEAIDGDECGASGFFFQVISENDQETNFMYAITNSHVIFGYKSNSFLRINTKKGEFDVLETNQSDWFRHPDGDDVAIKLIRLDDRIHDYLFFYEPVILTRGFINEECVGIGDEVVMIGRFRAHAGKKKNLPAAMFGNISMMPDEPIYNSFTKVKQESFLIEMRSIPGNSGSPVVLYLPPFSPRPGTRYLKGEWKYRLIGICWGQINVSIKAYDRQENEYSLNLESAMTGVVPAWKIMEMINDEEMRKQREKVLKN
jgi:hypothetical protein